MYLNLWEQGNMLNIHRTKKLYRSTWHSKQLEAEQKKMEAIEELPENKKCCCFFLLSKFSPQDFLLAATLIQDAVEGRNLVYKTDSKSIR